MLGAWVGFRPCRREGVRLELEPGPPRGHPWTAPARSVLRPPWRNAAELLREAVAPLVH